MFITLEQLEFKEFGICCQEAVIKSLSVQLISGNKSKGFNIFLLQN